MLKKIAGVLLLVIGLFFAVSSLKMIFVDTPKMKSALKDAVYVGQGAINDANDGKIVIVCGPFELTTPSYDDELGLTIDSIRTSRSKQTMKLNKATKATKANAETLTEEEKRNGVLEWSTAYRDKTLTGEGKIGNYTLSQDFIDAIVLNGTWHDYDRSELEASGYVWVTDANFFYSQYTNVICPSCGATVTLTSDEDHCPYCGGYIKSDFFDWQTEEFLIYRDYNPNTRNFKLTAATMIAFFIPAIPCFRFILPHSYFLALGSAFVITALLALLLWLRILRKTDNIEDLKKQIVRYDEKVLHSDLNEALYEKTVSSELLYYSVDQLQLQAVENTDTRTQITLHAILHQLILSPNHQISASNQPIDLKLYRARYPQRMKSKGQAVYAEKECPRCGANFIPDQDGCCSYCGYRLPIDNSKWRILEQ